MPNPKTLKSTIGKSWMHRTVTYQFMSLKENADSYDIATDSQWLNIRKSMVAKFLKELLPVDDHKLPLKRNGEIQLEILKENSQSLITILKDNIEKVQADASYVKQAREVTKTAKTIIDIAKLELEVKRTLR